MAWGRSKEHGPGIGTVRSSNLEKILLSIEVCVVCMVCTVSPRHEEHVQNLAFKFSCVDDHLVAHQHSIFFEDTGAHYTVTRRK